MSRWLRSPALHMLALGALLFGATRLPGLGPLHKKPRIEIAAHRVQQMYRDFVDQNVRPPTREEWQQILDVQIDDEVLFQYALALGMQENSAAQARLAQIADFVEANPHGSPEEGAKAALALGLHEGDLVVRRILTDSARRLIRSVVLLQEPRQELVEQFFAANAEEYTRPAQVRLSHVAINGFKWPDTEARARALLSRIRQEALSHRDALALADESLVPPSLPLTTEQSLEGEFGRDFATAVMKLPPGQWSEPIPSRYGHHLVFVHERLEAALPPLAEVRDTVQRRLLEKLADEWLMLRLRELRAEYDIVLPERGS
ncbi:peptidylprolyl isomerase [Hyalangium gracile]|uniref:peptidylprolyl isomerase n=1 Tax=Hyalangium gracile TaxID=394092 RepID=UPI001CCFF26A|nr:peptidylprolyl isomerase [Hyalangium gracile]